MERHIVCRGSAVAIRKRRKERSRRRALAQEVRLAEGEGEAHVGEGGTQHRKEVGQAMQGGHDG